MERLTLKQRSFFEKREFKITDEGLETVVQDFENDVVEFWHFDKFTNENRIYTEKYPKVLIFGLIAIFIGTVRLCIFNENTIAHAFIAGGIATVVGICLILLYFIVQKRYLLLELDGDDEGKQLWVLYNNPNKQAFDEFIATFYKKRKQDYRKRYFHIDFKGEKEQQINRMKWLKDEKIISQAEYEVVLDEINGTWFDN